MSCACPRGQDGDWCAVCHREFLCGNAGEPCDVCGYKRLPERLVTDTDALRFEDAKKQGRVIREAASS